jgi:hypothetical protein
MMDGGAELPRHVAVDPFQATDWHSVGAQLVERAGLESVVQHRAVDSLVDLPARVARGEKYDLAFVDGGHWFENAFCDMLYCSRLVEPGRFVVVDDTWMASVRCAIEYATSNLGLIDETPRSPLWKNLCVLRTPREPVKRAWDHFVAFAAVARSSEDTASDGD